MTPLIRLAANIIRANIDNQDYVSYAIVATKEAQGDYEFFINQLECMIKLHSEIIDKLKQEKDELKQNLEN